MKPIPNVQTSKIRAIFLLAAVPLLSLSGLGQTVPATTTDGTTSGDSTVKMNPFLVSQDSTKGYLASQTVSGSKTAMAIIDIPQSIDVITRDLMDDTGLTDPNALMEALVPGVSSLTGPGVQGINAIIRGFRSQNWAVDGAESRYLSEMVSDNFEDIEVIKGPAATLYGPAGAFGGYINVMMKTASPTPVDKVVASVGTGDYIHGMVDVGATAGKGGDFQYRTVLSYQDYRFPDRNYDYNRVISVMPSIAYDFTKETRVTVRFEYIHSNEYWSPSVLGLNYQPLPFSPGEPGERYIDIERTLQAILTSRINDQWTFKLNTLMQTMADDWLYGADSTSSPAIPQAQYTFTPNKRIYTQKTWYGDATLDWKIEDLGMGFSNDAYWDANIEYFDENIHFLSNSMLGSTPSLPNPLFDPTNPNISALYSNFTYSGTETVPYSTELEPGIGLSENFGALHDRLNFIVRARYNYDARTSEVLLTTPANTPPPASTMTGSPAVLNTNEKMTYDYGAVFKIVKGWSVYYGHSESYLPVGTGQTYTFQPLATETGKNDEVGTKSDFPLWGGVLSGTIALFKSDVDNLWIPDQFHPGFFAEQGDQKNSGIDSDVTYSCSKFTLIAGFYNAKGPYQQGQPANAIQPAGDLRAVYAPKVTYNIWGKYNVLKNLSVGGGYRHSGNQLSSSRALVSPGFGTTDVFVNYTLPYDKNRISLQVSCTNLNDEKGIDREDNVANVYLEEGRRIKFTTSYIW